MPLRARVVLSPWAPLRDVSVTPVLLPAAPAPIEPLIAPPLIAVSVVAPLDIAPPVVPAGPAVPPTSPPLVPIVLSRLLPVLHAPTASTAASASMLLPFVIVRMGSSLSGCLKGARTRKGRAESIPVTRRMVEASRTRSARRKQP
ncbi:MAG TPA: hypothetical protein VFG69_15905 [Nannocystaceae bacterium]|nr:hypothetical protein [Nannocystaceae bacterium]